MATFLFDEIIFGPVSSRRLGSSLGINLLPTDHKYCNFNCLYCECGLTARNYGIFSKDLPSREKIASELDKMLASFREKEKKIDTLTFAGNGEPTLHPSFPGIIDDTLSIGKKHFPDAKVAVLSNATLISDDKILHALQKVDFNILKLDSAFEDSLRKINCPLGNFSIHELVASLKKVSSNLTIQTLFVSGSYKGYAFDNTSPAEVAAWLDLLRQLQPELVMVYTIARDTPIKTINKISREKLNEIADTVRQAGLSVTVSS